MRTNLVPGNPHCSSSTGLGITQGRFGTTHSTSNPASGGPDNGGFERYTATGSASTPTVNTDIQNFAQGGNFGPPVTGATCPATPGVTYTASFYVRCSVAQKVHIQAQYLKYTPGIVGALGTVSGPDVTLVPNVWTRLSVTSTAGADAMALRVDLDSGASGLSAWGAAGDTLDVAMVTVTVGPTAWGYFDGSMFGYKWDGAANASTSSTNPVMAVLNYANNPIGWNGSAGSITGWSQVGTGGGPITTVTDATAPVGGHFLRKTATDALNTGFGLTTATVLPEGNYNVSFWVRYNVATSFTLFLQGSASKAPNQTTIALSANTWTRVSLNTTVTLIGTLQAGGFITTNQAVNNTLDITGLMIVPGTATLNYFDGFTPGAAWAGANSNFPSYTLQPVHFGPAGTPVNMYVGGNRVSKVYMGTKQVWGEV